MCSVKNWEENGVQSDANVMTASSLQYCRRNVFVSTPPPPKKLCQVIATAAASRLKRSLGQVDFCCGAVTGNSLFVSETHTDCHRMHLQKMIIFSLFFFFLTVKQFYILQGVMEQERAAAVSCKMKSCRR